MTDKIKCPRCGGTIIWKKGTTPGSHKQRLVCWDCGKTFYHADSKTHAVVKARSIRKKTK